MSGESSGGRRAGRGGAAASPAAGGKRAPQDGPPRKLSAEDRGFLARYDTSGFERPSVAVDVCVLTIVDGEVNVLVVRRQQPPFAGMAALPGGFVGYRESLEDAARRLLAEKAGIEDIYLEQLYTFGAPDRDPRTRVISVAYYALVPKERLRLRPGALPIQHGWARIVAGDEEGGGERDADDGTRSAVPVHEDRLVDLDGAPVELAFDHEEVVRTALKRVRGKLTYTTIAFQLVPEQFTLTELQRIYEVILRRTLSKPAFRRRILDAGVVEGTGAMRRGGHRPARLYRFVRDDPGGEM